MQSYLNDTKLKKDFIKEVKWHEDQDKIIQGTYGKGDNGDWKGCAVGCFIHSLGRLEGEKLDTSNHKLYETKLGIPEWLARLEDTIFEGLPKDLAMKWPLRFSKAIPVGVDLEPIKWKFSAFILSENIERVLTLNISDDLKKQVVDSIRGVLTLHEEAIKTGSWNESAAESAWSARSAAESAWSAAESARSAAESAAESAAWSAAGSAAGSAARSAESAWSARSAAWSAWSAAESARSAESAWSAWFAGSAAESAAESAWSAAESARSAAESARSAWSAAESAAYERYADKLIELLKASK
jgi:hypothetical protein